MIEMLSDRTFWKRFGLGLCAMFGLATVAFAFTDQHKYAVTAMILCTMTFFATAVIAPPRD